MALQFDSGAYGQAFNKGQENEQYNNNRLLQLLQQLGQTGSNFLQLADQRKKQLAENRTLGELYPDVFNSSNRLSSPVANTQMPNVSQQSVFQQAEGPGLPVEAPQQPGIEGPQLPMEGPRPVNHIEGFQQFLKGQKPQVPNSMNAEQNTPLSRLDTLLANPGKLRMKDYASLTEARKNLTANQPKTPGKLTIDQILADKVASGEITIEDALKMKQQQVGIFNVDQSGNASQIGTAPKGSIITRPGSGPGGSKAPTGFRFTSDGNLEMIPGGPADLTAQTNKQKQDAALAAQQQEAKTVIGKIDSALSKVGNLSSGWGSFTKNIPGSPAMNLSADLDSIHSSLGLDKLMEMKANSKAGASGMGQLSDREMSLLISNIASLKQSQTPDQLRDKLNQVKEHYQNILQMNQGINPFQNGQQPGQVNQGGQKPKTVIQNGHTYTLNEATGQYE